MEPVLGQAIIGWNQVNVTSVAVTQTTDFTVAFLGTDDGYLKKVCAFRNANCLSTELLEVDLSQPIHRFDMFWMEMMHLVISHFLVIFHLGLIYCFSNFMYLLTICQDICDTRVGEKIYLVTVYTGLGP